MSGPLPIDPAVRIGQLDNGLTYYVRSNEAPGESLELRLVVNSGSLQQVDERDGSAHFLEHMLFNGTEMFPGNQIDDVLSELGAEIGPDLNAFTSYDETVYLLSLPTGDPETVETGFDILHEWAERALIDPDEVVAERGVVREEIRLSAESPSAPVVEEFNDAYYGATSYADRQPGGEQDLILEMEDATMRDFYDTWYRPDLIAIVAVGDLPVDVMEQEIVERFSNFAPRAETPVREDPVVGPITETDIRVVPAPGTAVKFSSIDFWIPNRDLGTVEGERAEILDRLAATMIGNRLRDAVTRGETQMLDPVASTFNDVRDMRFLGFNVDGPDLADATEYILVELADVLTNGFTEQELSRAVSAQQTGNDFLLDAAETRQDAAFADLYAGHFLAGADISAVEDAHQRIADVLASVSAAEVSENLTLALADSAPIIIVTGPDEDELPTVADLEAAVAAGEAAIGAPPGDDEDNTEVPTTLMERPEPVEESTSRDLPRLSPSGRNCGICETAPIELVFENGVTIRFVESTIASGQATLAAVSSGGWSTLPAGSSALAPIATAAVSGSGLGDVDRVSLERFLAANSAQVGPYIDETEEGFFGSTGVDDLETLFQLLHLLVTEPRVDEPALRSEVESARELNEAADTDGGVALELALLEIRYGGAESQRLLATDEELDDIDETEMLALYSERLGQVDDLVVAVVGDVDRQAVLDLSRSYLGTLPEGPSDTWIDVQPDAPAGVVEATIEVGTENSAGAVAMLSTSGGEISAGLRVASDLTRIILNARLFETLRESLAATYGGSVSIQLQTAPKSLAESLVLIEGDPERLDEIHAAVLAELGDLSTNGPTEEEFEQGRAVLRQDYALVNNGTAMELLLSPEQRPGEEVLDLDLRIEILEQLTAADIQIVAGALFPDDQRIDLFRVPAG